MTFLLNIAIQSAVITVLCLAVCLLLRRHAAMRYAICAATFVLLAASPVTAYLATSTGWTSVKVAVLPPKEVPPLTDATAAVTRSSKVELASYGASAGSMPQLTELAPQRTIDWNAVLLSLWCVGVGLGALRLLRSAVAIRFAALSAATTSEEKLQDAIASLREGIGLRKLPPVLISSSARGPVALCWPKRMIILPEAVVQALTTVQLRDVLAHELAHIEQGHAGLSLLQFIVQTAYWPHPLVHLVAHQLSKAREEVCDNFVLHLSSGPSFARTLLTVAETVSARPAYPATAGLLLPRWKLEQRVSGLLDPSRQKTIRLSRTSMTMLNASLLSVCALAAGVQLTHAQSTVEIRQNGKVYVLKPSASKPVTITLKNKNSRPTTLHLTGKSDLSVVQYNTPSTIPPIRRQGRYSVATTPGHPMNWVVYRSGKPEKAVIVQGTPAPDVVRTGRLIRQTAPTPPTIVEAPLATTGQWIPPAQAPAARGGGLTATIEVAPAPPTGTQTIEVAPLASPVPSTEHTAIISQAPVVAQRAMTGSARGVYVTSVQGAKAPLAYRGTVQVTTPQAARLQYYTAKPLVLQGKSQSRSLKGQHAPAIVSTPGQGLTTYYNTMSNVTLRDLLIRARSKAAQEGKTDLVKQLQEMIDKGGR